MYRALGKCKEGIDTSKDVTYSFSGGFSATCQSMLGHRSYILSTTRTPLKIWMTYCTGEYGQSENKEEMGLDFLRIERIRSPIDAWPFHFQRSRRGDPQTNCVSSTRYLGNLPLCTLSSLATVREETKCTQRGVLWHLCNNIGDDRVNDASDMLREWKSVKRMDKDIIAPDRFNAGYDKGYKEWLKKTYKTSPPKPLIAFVA